MRTIALCSLLLTALTTHAFAAYHSSAAKMLENAAINHDLARIRMSWERRIENRHDFRTERNSLGSHATNGKAASPY